MVLNMCIGICTPPVGSGYLSVVVYLNYRLIKLSNLCAILCRDGIGAGNGDLYSANHMALPRALGY